MGDSASTKTDKTNDATALLKQTAPDSAAQLESSRGAIFDLQRAAGNEAVTQLVEAGTSETVRRKCATCESGGAPCAECSERDEAIRRKSTSSVENGPALSAGLSSYIAGSIGRGASLNGSVRAPLETSFGTALGQVRVHSDADAAKAAAELNAEAFTLGGTIWFGQEMYRPESARGRHLIAHEVAHTLQQRGDGVARSLIVGKSSDPSEQQADRAADLAVSGQRVASPGSSPSVIRRKVKTVGPGANSDQRLVEMEDGTRYKVNRFRTITTETSEEYLPPRIKPKIDFDKVSIKIEWCKGTKGEIELGADAPKQVQDLAKRIGGVIQKGGTSDEVLKEIQGSKITPFAKFDIAKSGDWKVTGEINVTVGKGGVTAAGGKVGVEKGPFGGFIEGKKEEGGGSLQAGFEYKFGRETKKFTCPTREVVKLVQRTTYQCVKETRVPAKKEERTRMVPRLDERSRYIYFQYADDKIEEKQSTSELAKLSSDLQEGYKVSNIKAFTSPEGPMAPARRFRGNEQLARDRAKAAFDKVKAICPSPKVEGEAGSGCFISREEDVTPTGEGELYTIVKETPKGPKEVEGKELEEHAVGEFLEKPEEERHRTPELVEELGKTKSSKKKAEKVYPLLRRAVLTLQKTVQVEEKYTEEIPEHTEEKAVECPEDALDQAISNFRISG